jgi:hypothetical protein
LSSSATPGANADGRETTTVRASGAVTRSGLRCTATPEASELATAGSYSAWKVKRTSADVNGAPSENVTPSRSVRVIVCPSADVVQRSASQGSASPVTRLTRTSVAWTRRVTASTGA